MEPDLASAVQQVDACWVDPVEVLAALSVVQGAAVIFHVHAASAEP